MCSFLSAPKYEVMLIIIILCTMFCASHCQQMNTTDCIFTCLLCLTFSHICTLVISHQHAFLTDQQLMLFMFRYKSFCRDTYRQIATKPIYFVFTALAKSIGSIAFFIHKHLRQKFNFHYYSYYVRCKHDT